MKLEIIYKKINEIIPYKNNPRKNDNAIDSIVILWKVAICGIEDVGVPVEISFITNKEPTIENKEKIETLLNSSKQEKSLSSYYRDVKFIKAEVIMEE